MAKLYFIVIISIVAVLASCGPNYKLVSEYNFSDLRIRHFKAEKIKSSSKKSLYYVMIEHEKVQTFYSFFPKDIYKSSNRNKAIYKLVYTDTPLVKLSTMDSVVLNNANYILDSLKVDNLNRVKNPTGFVITN